MDLASCHLYGVWLQDFWKIPAPMLFEASVRLTNSTKGKYPKYTCSDFKLCRQLEKKSTKISNKLLQNTWMVCLHYAHLTSLVDFSYFRKQLRSHSLQTTLYNYPVQADLKHQTSTTGVVLKERLTASHTSFSSERKLRPWSEVYLSKPKACPMLQQ